MVNIQYSSDIAVRLVGNFYWKKTSENTIFENEIVSSVSWLYISKNTIFQGLKFFLIFSCESHCKCSFSPIGNIKVFPDGALLIC